jgi:hypothetical protein
VPARIYASPKQTPRSNSQTRCCGAAEFAPASSSSPAVDHDSSSDKYSCSYVCVMLANHSAQVAQAGRTGTLKARSLPQRICKAQQYSVQLQPPPNHPSGPILVRRYREYQNSCQKQPVLNSTPEGYLAGCAHQSQLHIQTHVFHAPPGTIPRGTCLPTQPVVSACCAGQ